MKKRVYVMAVMIAVVMSCSNLTVNAQEKVKLNAASKEKTLEVTLELPVTEKGIDAMAGTLDYDHAKLELTEMKTGDSRLQEPVYNSDNGKFTTVIKSETIKESVNAVQFVFKKKADAAGETIVRVSELTVATAEDTKQMLDAASVTITLGDTTKPSEDKNDSKNDSPTTDKSDSSATGENNSSNSGTTDEERNRKTDTAERKNGVKTGDVADMSVWIAGIAVSAGVLIALRIRKRKIK